MNSNYAPAVRTSSVSRYIVVGLIANGLGLVVFQGLVLINLWPEFSSLLSFFPAFLLAYVLNRRWSFSSTIGHLDGVSGYAIVTIASLALQMALVSLLYRGFGILPFLAQVVAVGITTPVSYLLLKHWVFQR